MHKNFAGIPKEIPLKQAWRMQDLPSHSRISWNGMEFNAERAGFPSVLHGF